ncbi:MAG: ATP-binding protein [Comamonadaceae bacterium]|nr:ATP-binding protein [Comamonadaceae bacterium]
MAPGAHRVQADASRLQQIVWNLLSNAIKFSRPGGRIELAVESDDREVRLTVRDEGQGIRADFLPYVFDRFSQSDTASTRLHGGLGLGLSIVKRLAQLHGGSVGVSSEGPGCGASFVVALPRIDAAPPPSPAADAAGAAAETPPQASPAGLDILLVEDDDDSREMLAMVLGGQDAQVRTAADHDAALQRLAEGRPDVLISDIGLPGKDGCELVRRVRAAEAPGDARAPCIALTAFARPQDRDAALAAGFDTHCAKPLHPNELVAAILAAVRGR